MAQNTDIAVAANAWTQLTNSGVTSVTFQNASPYQIRVKGTIDDTAPTTLDGAILYAPGQGERNVALSDLFPGIASVGRVWAYCESRTRVMVSHA